MSQSDRDVAASDLGLKGFKAYEIHSAGRGHLTYSRKDFFKICLITGENQIEFADKSLHLDGTTLFFGTAHVPYSWEVLSDKQTGYACLFTEEFLKISNPSNSLHTSSLFRVDGTPIFSVDETQKQVFEELFRKMLADYNSDYPYKEDLIRNYINLMIHEALKMNPSEIPHQPKQASTRISTFFLELLERQFPIDGPWNPLKMRTASDFAEVLAVHVNHLNHSIKEVTGKSTSTIIAERIATEAKSLLTHSDMSVSDIAYSLGFEHTSYFNYAFKRATGNAPSYFRKQSIGISGL